jgi:hypothetical protein
MKDYWQLREELKGSSKLVNESWDAYWKEWSRKFGGDAALAKKLRGGWTPGGITGGAEWSELWAETIIREYGLDKNSSKSSKSGNSSKPKKLNPSDFRFDPEDKKIFTKLSKGKKDNLGFPNFSGVTICDFVSLSLDDMVYVIDGLKDSYLWNDNTKELLDAWILDGMKTLESVAVKIETAFNDWFGSDLMGRGKASVLGVFKAIQACPTRGDWTKADFKGTLYRGKTMSWDKLKELRWKRVGNDLHAEGIYQSRLGAQSWTRSIAVAKNFARSAGNSQASGSPEAELHISGISGGVMPKPGTGKVSGSAPVIVSAEVPIEQRMLSERASRKIAARAGIGSSEEEVIRVSNAPIKAKFILTKGTLVSAVRNDSEAVAYIYKTLLREK